GLVSRDLHQQELVRGAYSIHVATDAVVASFNRNHQNYVLLKERGLTQRELEDIFVHRKYKLWSDLDARFIHKPIEVYVRSDAAGAAETWAKFMRVHQEGLKGVGIFGDPGLVQAIKDKPLSIGFSNINFVYDLNTKQAVEHIAILPLDLDGDGHINKEEDFYDHLDSLTQAVATNRYPSPPSRDLTFVIHADKKTALLTAFIKFVLEKEQQSYLLDNGYVPLNDEIKNNELNKLK